MFAYLRVITILLSAGLSLGLASDAVAQIPQAPNSASTRALQPESFQAIDRPLSAKLAVTVGGVALIAAELWWFQLSKTKTRQASVKQGLQEIAIAVDGGYSPNRVVVRVGQPVRLNFIRTDPSSCLETVILPDFHRAVDLHLDSATSVEFTPERTGEFPFHCGMNVFQGTVVVRDRPRGGEVDDGQLPA